MAKDTHDTDQGHPVPAAVRRAQAVLGDVTDTPLWSLTGLETRTAIADLARLRARADELEARLIAHGETIEAFAGATTAAAWLAHTTRIAHAEAKRRVTLAHALPSHEQTRDAMAAGHVLADQAAAITRAVEELPDQVELRALCEKELVGLAEHHDAVSLRRAGRKVLAVVDPDAADAHENKLLMAEEKAASRKTTLAMWEPGDGTMRGKFTVPAEVGQMLRRALMATAAPKHVRATGGTYDHERPTPDKLGQAFVEYVSRYPVDKLPSAGGINATVVVTMPLDTLLGGLEPATVDGVGRLSADAVRRLACEAGIVPMVLDGQSRPLDVGRTKRFHTEAQRLALNVSQRHCQHPTCDAPAWLCHVHHKTPWSRGGRTDLHDAQLLCPRHHALAHRDPPPRPMRT